MKSKYPNELALALREFFGEFLPKVKGTSPLTLASYRDSIVLLLRFVAAQQGRTVSVLDFEHIDAPQILSFLTYLESERHNTATTRNVRLSAFHSFFRYTATRLPHRLAHCQQILVIPATVKRDSSIPTRSSASS